jgi:hydrogenase nickel incorporation protein HypA/HybF
MYELQYTQQIVDAIIHELPIDSDKKVKKIKVLIGEKYQLDPNAIQLHFQNIIQETILEGASLDLAEDFIEVLCNACGFGGPIKASSIMMCSACMSKNVKPIAGTLVNIQAVEYFP